MDIRSCRGRLVVVETESNAWIGTLHRDGADKVKVMTGLQGHPVSIAREDIVEVILADEHPLVVHV